MVEIFQTICDSSIVLSSGYKIEKCFLGGGGGGEGLQVLTLNDFHCYKIQCDIGNIFISYYHIEFRKACLLAWTNPETYW